MSSSEGSGSTFGLDKAIYDFQDMTGHTFDPDLHFIYEGKEVHVECKFAVVKENRCLKN